MRRRPQKQMTFIAASVANRNASIQTQINSDLLKVRLISNRVALSPSNTQKVCVEGRLRKKGGGENRAVKVRL